MKLTSREKQRGTEEERVTGEIPLPGTVIPKLSHTHPSYELVLKATLALFSEKITQVGVGPLQQK